MEMAIRAALILLICSAWTLIKPLHAEGQHFIYLSDQRILTLEVVDPSTAVFNYVNLGQTYEVFKAPKVVLLDEQGKGYRGHVFQVEEGEEGPAKFKVSDLVKPGQYKGYLLRGDLRVEGAIDRVAVGLGGRFAELEKLESREFEVQVARISELDLTQKDRVLALERVGFQRGYGVLHAVESEEAQVFRPFLGEEEILPPVIIKNPAPRLPSSKAEQFPSAIVQVRAFVSVYGGVSGVEINRSLDPVLDEMALQTVQNSWLFLPAISDGKVVSAELTLNVKFE